MAPHESEVAGFRGPDHGLVCLLLEPFMAPSLCRVCHFTRDEKRSMNLSSKGRNLRSEENAEVAQQQHELLKGVLLLFEVSLL